MAINLADFGKMKEEEKRAAVSALAQILFAPKGFHLPTQVTMLRMQFVSEEGKDVANG